MRKSTCWTGSFAVLLAVVLAGDAAATRGAAPAGAGPGQRQAFPGVVVLKLQQALPAGASKAGGPVDAILSRHAAIDLAPVDPYAHRPSKPGGVDLGRVYFAHYSDGAPPEAVAAELSRLPGVEYAEPKWIYPLDAVPNDPSYSTQSTYLTRMQFPLAWDTTKGQTGSVIVAIVDGGTNWQHVDLQTNIWTNPGEIAGNGIDDDNNGFIDDVRGWNFANGTNDPTGLLATPNNAWHGTHTAGIVCATADNATGVAGASWNAKVMPICTSSPITDNAIAYGYEGILYAADNGASVINCSWGGLGSASSFEQDVIAYAWETGSAVVAAAGNDNSLLPHYPSSYPHVLSVANVSRFDVKDNTSNYGTTVDVSAVGQSILSTIPGNAYGFSTGTSMSSPHAAAVCALVKTRWPGYTPDQVMERVRVTSDNIDGINPSRRGLLGYGRVNAAAALTKNTPAVRITGLQFTETDGDGIIEPGETVNLSITVTNFLASCTGLAFTLRETSTQASLVDSTVALGSLDSLQSVQLPVLHLNIAPSAGVQQVVDCQLLMSTAAPAYIDKDRFSLTVLPTFVNHTANNVVTSVTSVGKLGFSVVAGGNGSDGVGFKYKNTANLLYEGALLIGTSAAKISDAARNAIFNPPTSDADFKTMPGGVPHLLQPGPLAPQQTVASFSDSTAVSPLRVVVRQDTYEYTDPVHDDYVILRYTIHNTGAAALTGLRVGWYCDWDVDGGTFATNKTGFDAARNLGYVYDTGSGPRVYVGTRVLNDAGATAFRGIWNDQTLATDWGVYDGFTDTEKWDCLAGGIVHPEAGPEDISDAIATGPFDVAAGDSVEVGFAFVGGVDLPDLQTNADAAALKWQHIHSGLPVEVFDLAAEQDGADVQIQWRTAAESDVVAYRIFRSQDNGPLQALQPDVTPNGDRSYAFRDRDPGPGNYFYRVGEVGTDGGVVLHGGVGIIVTGAAPLRPYLAPATPNPFNPSTVLEFGVTTAGPVALEIYDARGRLVRGLYRSAFARPGIQRVRWDGRDDSGRGVASGVYIARMQTSGSTFTRRLTLLK